MTSTQRAPRTWGEIRADLRPDEGAVTMARQQIEARQSAYRLAEIRKEQGLTQGEVAKRIGISQSRVSQLERGELSKSELSTVDAYVTALGGRARIIADFGDRSVVVS